MKQFVKMMIVKWDSMMNNVIILGAGRSGTSAVAGSFIGNFNRGGPLHQPNIANPKGFFEANMINRINDDILWSCPNVITTKGLKQGWLSRLDGNIVISDISKDIENRIESSIKDQPVILKDPRFSYTLPIWLRYLNNLKIICVFRNPQQFLSSLIHHCKTQEYLRNLIIDEEFFQEIWLSTYTYILKNYSNIEILFIDYEDVLNNDGLERLSDFTGYKTNYNFPEKALQRSKNNQEVRYNLMEMYGTLRMLSCLNYNESKTN